MSNNIQLSRQLITTLHQKGLSMPNSSDAAPNDQIAQHFGFSVINTACREEKDSKKICSFKYLFTAAAFRPTVKDWGREKWFIPARVMAFAFL